MTYAPDGTPLHGYYVLHRAPEGAVATVSGPFDNLLAQDTAAKLCACGLSSALVIGPKQLAALAADADDAPTRVACARAVKAAGLAAK